MDQQQMGPSLDLVLLVLYGYIKLIAWEVRVNYHTVCILELEI